MKRRIIVIIVSTVFVLTVAIIGLIWLFDPTTRMTREVVGAIDTVEKSKISMVTINNKFTVTQNEKNNVNINQGVFIKDDETQQVGIAANIDYTSTLSPGNNYKMSLDIWKNEDKILEKQGNSYEASDITLSEFNEAIKNYKIYRISQSDIKKIEAVESVDKTTTMYQITLNKLDDSLATQYLESISKQIGEKFDKSQIQTTNAVIVASISDGVLKSQQLKFYLEIKSKINEIKMSNVSEININLDADTIHNNFLGRGK